MMKLSKTSKLGTKSWSLQAVQDCPGSIGADGQLVPACSGCYATTGCYNFKGTKAVRAVNREAWKEPGFVDAFTAALKKEKHFRWFDSGDMYSLSLAKKIYAIMVATPGTKHWLPTRMQKFAKFQPIIKAMNELPNVMVRFSSDEIDGTYTKGLHGSTIVPEGDSTDAFICSAPSQGGKCLDCRACYDKSIPVIGYIAHGRKMKKIIRIQKETV